MSPVTFIYLADVVPSVGNLMAMLGAAFALAILFMLLSFVIEGKTYGSKPYVVGALCALVSAISALLPSKKTIYMMGAAAAIVAVSENDKVQALSGKVVSILEGKLDEYINETKPKESK